jgi:hypothetical protein
MQLPPDSAAKANKRSFFITIFLSISHAAGEHYRHTSLAVRGQIHSRKAGNLGALLPTGFSVLSLKNFTVQTKVCLGNGF